MTRSRAPDSALHRERFFSLLVVVILAIVLAGSGAGQAFVREVFQRADALIATNPDLGMVVFVVLAALSAMFAFFSSALLLPVAIYAWGSPLTLALLWLGWFAGGICAWTIGRHLGRNVVSWLVPSKRLAAFEQRLQAEASFGRVLLFHLVVPSEMPGYVLGILRYPLRRYAAALAVAEIPFAAGAIFLGRTFVEGDLVLFMILGAIALAVSFFTTRWYLRRERHVSAVT